MHRPVWHVAIALAFSIVGFACGDIEPKPNEIPPNLQTNNSNSECTSDAQCGFGEACINGACVGQCVLDTDCIAPDVCETGGCVPACNVDADCAAGEACIRRVNGVGSICSSAPVNNISPGGCSDNGDPNAFCEAQLGAGAFCDTIADECVGGEMPDAIFVAQIFDVTSQADACNVLDPGSDIQGIELATSTGTTLGWGSLVAETVNLDGNEEANFGLIDGTPPSLDADGCVDSFSGNVLALGCNGWIAVEFLDDGGTPVALESGQILTVYEYGGTCSTGSLDDEYTVLLCNDTGGINGGDDSSCNLTIGTGSGVNSFTISL